MNKLTALIIALGALVFTLNAGEILLDKANVIKKAPEMIPVDSTKTYNLTVIVKGGTGRFLCYLYQFNAAKRRINYPHANGNADSITTLTAPAIRGAESFTVADASKWAAPVSGKNIVAFNAKEDFSDLPNFRIEYYIKSITKQDDGSWKIEMTRPLASSCPAGAKVRQHFDADHFCFNVALPLANDTLTGLMKPANGIGPQGNIFWNGTKYVQLAFRTTGNEPVTVVSWSLTESGK